MALINSTQTLNRDDKIFLQNNDWSYQFYSSKSDVHINLHTVHIHAHAAQDLEGEESLVYHINTRADFFYYMSFSLQKYPVASWVEVHAYLSTFKLAT